MNLNGIKRIRDPRVTVNSRLTEGYLISDGKIYREDLSQYWDDVPIRQLGLSVRSSNALMRAGLTMLSDVLLLSVDEIKNIKNLGGKSVEETVAVTCGYFETTSNTSAMSGEEKIEEKAPELIPENPTIDMIPLSVRACNAIGKCGYRYVAEIADFTYYDYLQIKNMGKNSALEAYEKVQSFLEEYREKLAFQRITPKQKSGVKRKAEEKRKRAEAQKRRPKLEADKQKYEDDLKRWETECESVKGKRSDRVNEMIAAKKIALAAAAEQTRDKAIATSNETITIETKRKQEAEAKLASLGTFKFSEKKTQKRIIEDATRLIAQAQAAIPAAQAACLQELKEVDRKAEDKRDFFQKASERELPLPVKPSMPQSLIQEEERIKREKEEKRQRRKEEKKSD